MAMEAFKAIVVIAGCNYTNCTQYTLGNTLDIIGVGCVQEYRVCESCKESFDIDRSTHNNSYYYTCRKKINDEFYKRFELNLQEKLDEK